MNNKFFLLIFAVFLIGNVFALTQVGEDEEGSFDVDVGKAGIVIGENETCAENWTCSYWSACANNNRSFECRDCSSCGTYALLPQNCGAIESCQQQSSDDSSGNSGSSSSSSGSSGGIIYYSGSNNCAEKWECSEWSECQNGNQKRTCTDKNKCRTTFLKPAEEQVCENDLVLNENDTGAGVLAGITGAVIGVLGPTGALGVAIFIVAMIALTILVFIMKKKESA